MSKPFTPGNVHANCRDAYQYALDVGVWPEHRCNGMCQYASCFGDDAGLRRLGNAIALWAGMARLWAGRCRNCDGTGVDYDEYGAIPCDRCNGRGFK